MTAAQAEQVNAALSPQCWAGNRAGPNTQDSRSGTGPVGKGGLEPPRLAAHAPKACASAYSATPPGSLIPVRRLPRNAGEVQEAATNGSAGRFGHPRSPRDYHGGLEQSQNPPSGPNAIPTVRQIGAEGYLGKPFRLRRLLDEVARLARRDSPRRLPREHVAATLPQAGRNARLGSGRKAARLGQGTAMADAPLRLSRPRDRGRSGDRPGHRASYEQSAQATSGPRGWVRARACRSCRPNCTSRCARLARTIPSNAPTKTCDGQWTPTTTRPIATSSARATIATPVRRWLHRTPAARAKAPAAWFEGIPESA
jgi:hypothetical protein